MSGASVMLMRHDNPVAETRSAQDGSFILAGKPGEYQLVVDGPTLITRTMPVRLAKGVRVDLPVKIAAVTDRPPGTTLGVPLRVSPQMLGKIKPPSLASKKGFGQRR